MQRLLKRIPQQARTVRKSAQSWREHIEQVERLLTQIEKLEAQYQENRRLLGQRNANLIAQQQLQQQQGQLSRQLAELRLALKQKQHEDDAPVYRAARELAAARAELIACSTAVRDAARRLDSQTHRRSVDQVVRQTAELLETDELPLWLVHGQVLIPGVIDGEPVSFLLDGDHRQTLVPMSQANRLGVDLTHAEWQKLQYGERELKVVPVKLTSLQIGSAVLSDHLIYVTSSADADFGPRLGTDASDKIGLRVDRATARILIGRGRSAP